MPTNAALAAKMLIQAAQFLDDLATRDPAPGDGLVEAARRYRLIATAVETDPDGAAQADLSLPDLAASGDAPAEPAADQPLANEPPADAGDTPPGEAAEIGTKAMFARLIDQRLLAGIATPFDATWQAMAPDDAAGLLQVLGRQLARDKADADWLFTSEAIALRCTPLKFYDGALLVDVVLRDNSGATGQALFVVFAHMVVPLTTVSDRVHDLNEQAPLRLQTDRDAILYLKFFCAVIWGDSGPFEIVETPFQQDGLQPSGDPNAVAPVTVTRLPYPEPHWRLKASVRYDDMLFLAEFRLTPDGLVEMLSDEPIASLPARNFSWRVDNAVRYRDDVHA